MCNFETDGVLWLLSHSSANSCLYDRYNILSGTDSHGWERAAQSIQLPRRPGQPPALLPQHEIHSLHQRLCRQVPPLLLLSFRHTPCHKCFTCVCLCPCVNQGAMWPFQCACLLPAHFVCLKAVHYTVSKTQWRMHTPPQIPVP